MSDPANDPQRAVYERRAPGWDIRCLKCGFSEPAGKYMIRRGACGRKCVLGRCARCRRICCHSVEKRRADRPTTPP